MNQNRTNVVKELVVFFDKKSCIESINQKIKEGWHVVSFINHKNSSVGIIEKVMQDTEDLCPKEADDVVYIPPRPKINNVIKNMIN